MHNSTKNLAKFKEGSLLALWFVAGDYQIEEGIMRDDSSPKSYVVTNQPLGNIYPSLTNKLLHRNFAKLNPNSNNDIIRFANKYGLLTGPIGVYPSGGGKQQFWGEPLSLWEKEIKDCGILLKIWEMIQNKDAGKLGQIILWRNVPNVAVFASFYSKRNKNNYMFTPGSSKPTTPMRFEFKILADNRVNSHLLERWQFGKVIEPALFYLRSEINEHLKGQFGFQLWAFDDELSIVPNNLKAAIWLMFAYEIIDKVKPAQCPLCMEWFEKDDKRRNYCSNACKQKAYRERKEKGGEK